MTHPKDHPQAARLTGDSGLTEAGGAQADETATQFLPTHSLPRVDLGPRQPGPPAPAGEIAIEALHAADTVWLRTANSTYTFCVADPAQRRGRLSGGACGDGQVYAVLMEVLDHENQAADSVRLKVGGRALFLIESADSFRRVITSPIIELITNDSTADKHCS